MQRREILAGLAAVFGGWAIGADRVRATQSPGPKPPGPRLLKMSMSDGALIALEVGGNGPSLLLVHGTAGTRKSWARVTPLLQSRYQTFAMNRRGRGDSRDGSTFSLAREAEDIARVADQLPGPVFVVGHSYGAIATFEALRLTGKIQRCVLYEPPFPVAGGKGGVSPDAVCAAVAAGDNERAMLTFFRDYVQLPAPMIEGFRADQSWRLPQAPEASRHGYCSRLILRSNTL
jgi:pimeloyl-ACP methyl ester carboxylesterase